MDRRKGDLLEVRNFIGKIYAEMTMILQQLQWDRSNLLERPTMVNCKYDSNHRIPVDRRDAHESQCFFISNGYSREDTLLPDPIDTNASTLIKLSKNEIETIVDMAAEGDPSFKRGIGSKGAEPMSLERLQASYTPDERRAIYDAVVKAAPSCHDLSDLALLSGNEDEQKNAKQKSRLEILAELRDMKRRRTKYRVAAKTRNYSDLLRDVIKTQMEVYTDVKGKHEEQGKVVSLQNKTEYHKVDTNNEIIKDRHHFKPNRSRDRSRDNEACEHSRRDFGDYNKRKEKYEQYYDVPSGSKVNKNYEDNHKKRKRNNSSERSDRHYKGRREFRYENASKADFEINKDTRIKKEKKDNSVDMPGVDIGEEIYSIQNQDEYRGRRSNTGNHREDKSKYKSGSSSYSGSYNKKDNVNQVYIKQEDESYYDESKYSRDRSKFRYEDYDRRKGEGNREKYKKELHTHRTSSREDRKREEEPRHRRYYD